MEQRLEERKKAKRTFRCDATHKMNVINLVS